jgi:hypothetical protein
MICTDVCIGAVVAVSDLGSKSSICSLPTVKLFWVMLAEMRAGSGACWERDDDGDDDDDEEMMMMMMMMMMMR